MIYRQGDVLIMQTERGLHDTAALSSEPLDDGRIVLAYGEVTGHAHAIADDGASLWRLSGDDRLLVVESDVALRHEEHAAITIPPGAYIVRRQREYVPAEQDVTGTDVGFRRSTYVAD